MARIPGVHELLQRVYGTGVSGQFTVSAGTAHYGPSVTIVPRITGKYRVLVHCGLYSSSGNIIAWLDATVGTPVWLNSPQYLAQTVAFSCANIEAEVLLTAGISYTFQVAVNSGSSGFIIFGSVNPGPSGEQMLVEQIV